LQPLHLRSPLSHTRDTLNCVTVRGEA